MSSLLARAKAASLSCKTLCWMLLSLTSSRQGGWLDMLIFLCVCSTHSEQHTVSHANLNLSWYNRLHIRTGLVC